MENTENVSACVGRACRYLVMGGSLACLNGDGSCSSAHLLEAEKSYFHDQQLIEATQQIRDILAGIGEDADGRELSFVHTNMGSLLVWVDHNGTVTEDAVTSDDDDATIAKALKLKNVMQN